MRNCIFLIYLLSLLSFSQEENIQLIDSAYSLIEEANKLESNDSLKLFYAQRASLIANQLSLDSLILKSNSLLSSIYYDLDEDEGFERITSDNLKVARRLKDTLAIADEHYNLGLSFEFYRINYDSAYYHYSRSLKKYNQINNVNGKINCLMAIADIQETEKDYVGSEENAINAIRLINTLPINEPNLDNLWSLNNLLGVTSQNLNRLNVSLDYHERALGVAKKMRNGEYNETISINNKAGVYRDLLNYEMSLELYQSLIPLREFYEANDPTFYPLIINNIAYTKLLAGHKDYQNIRDMFYKAYHLSNVLDDDITRLAVTIDLSKFYKNLQIKDSTLKYVEKAYALSKKISSNDILLESMVLLSELKDGDEGKKYLRDHIRLSDSLLHLERNKRNKFARIELETDELEAENEQISKENFYLALLSLGLLLTAVLIYVVISQRAKNRKLKLIQVQQKANEDIYNLMLGQQEKVDEARTQEKKRISEELHDGVLGRLFGTRLSLDSINFKEGKEAITTRANYINQLKTIEEDIRKISHELNTDFVSGSGFMDIVSELIENQSAAYGLKNEFDFTDDINWDKVNNKTKINIYRIIQECMQNIYKHAKAKSIKISISLEKNVICLDIIDDGVGFDTSKSKKGIGLKNMNSRVAEINGDIDVTSQSGNGTTVNVKIPYKNQST